MPTKGDFIRHNMSLAVQTNNLPDGTITGIASSPSVDAYGHRVLPGAFDKSIFAKGFDVGKGGIRLLDHHKDDGPNIGVIRKLETVGKDLRIEAELCLKSARVRDLYEETKFCGGSGFSVGFRLEDFEFIKEKDEDIFLIKSGELREISLVNFPANRDARTHVVKHDAQSKFPELEALLEDMRGIFATIKETNTVSELEKALVAQGLAHGRNEAHKLFLVMKSCAHLLQDKPTHAGGESKTSPHPLLDASMLAPVLKDLAKVQSLL